MDSASELNETDGSSTPPLDLQVRSNGVHMETSSDDDDNYDDPDSPINVAWFSQIDSIIVLFCKVLFKRRSAFN